MGKYKYLQFLKRHVWLLAAFFIPLAIRSIPEIISWPYPLGLDTLRYIPIMQSGQVYQSGPFGFIYYHLFYAIATLVYDMAPNGFLIIKIFGPILLALISLMMFIYAKCCLGWGASKSFLVALIAATYFVSLRVSWDLYSQSLGIIFLLATLIVLKVNSPRVKYPAAFIFMILTILSHELTAVILFFILGLEALRYLSKKETKSFASISILLGLSFGLFFYTHFSPSSIIGIGIIPAISAAEPSLDLVYVIGSMLVYCYALLLPLVILGVSGVKDWLLRFWAILCLAIPLITTLLPNSPLFYWNRWAYLLVYPILFFAVEGLEVLWKVFHSHRRKLIRLVFKIIAILYVSVLLILSIFYLTASPQSQISFFSCSNPSLSFIPSTMQQNTLPITENPALIDCFNWINKNAENNSEVVLHYALYDLCVLYIKDIQIIDVTEGPSMLAHLQNETSLVGGMISASQNSLAEGHSVVYTVWWVNGAGDWYKIPSMPQNFQVVYESGEMAVYRFNPL